MSMSRTASIVLPGALAAGCLALAWSVAPYLNGSVPESTPTGRTVIAVPPSEPAPVAQGLTQAPIRLASIQSFSATVERPIFAPNRRAPELPATVKVPVPTLPFDLSLKGIIFSPDTKLAVVSQGVGGKPVWLAEGDEYRGWKLAEITAKEAAFRQDNAVKRLILDYDGTASAGDGVTLGSPVPKISPLTESYQRPLRAQLKAVAGGTVTRRGRQPAAAASN